MSEYIKREELFNGLDKIIREHGDEATINKVRGLMTNITTIEAEDPLPKISKCPLCGYTAEITTSYSGWLYSSKITCGGCGISVSHQGDYNDWKAKVQIKAIEKWNGLKDRGGI